MLGAWRKRWREGIWEDPKSGTFKVRKSQRGLGGLKQAGEKLLGAVRIIGDDIQGCVASVRAPSTLCINPNMSCNVLCCGRNIGKWFPLHEISRIFV